MIVVGQRKNFVSTKGYIEHAKRNSVFVYRSRRIINTNLEQPAIRIPGTEPSKA